MPSEKCKTRLDQGPNCSIRKEVLGYVMCYTQQAMRTRGVDMSTGMKEAWATVKEKCSTGGSRPSPPEQQ